MVAREWRRRRRRRRPHPQLLLLAVLLSPFAVLKPAYAQSSNGSNGGILVDDANDDDLPPVVEVVEIINLAGALEPGGNNTLCLSETNTTVTSEADLLAALQANLEANLKSSAANSTILGVSTVMVAAGNCSFIQLQSDLFLTKTIYIEPGQLVRRRRPQPT